MRFLVSLTAAARDHILGMFMQDLRCVVVAAVPIWHSCCPLEWYCAGGSFQGCPSYICPPFRSPAIPFGSPGFKLIATTLITRPTSEKILLHYRQVWRQLQGDILALLQACQLYPPLNMLCFIGNLVLTQVRTPATNPTGSGLRSSGRRKAISSSGSVSNPQPRRVLPQPLLHPTKTLALGRCSLFSLQHALTHLQSLVFASFWPVERLRLDYLGVSGWIRVLLHQFAFDSSEKHIRIWFLCH